MLYESRRLASIVALVVVAGCDGPQAVAPPPLHADVSEVLAADDFDRADESPLASPWISGPAGFSNLTLTNGGVRGAATSGDGAAYFAATWPADQWSEARLAALGTRGDGGVAVRLGATGQTGYVFSVGGGGAWYALGKFVNGAFTGLVSGTLTFQPGDLLRLEAAGDTIRAYRNGTLVRSVIDNSIPDGNAGLFIYDDDPGFALDNWVGGGSPANSSANPPAPPTTLVAAAAGTGAIDLTWADQSDNEDGFTLQRCQGAGCTGFATVATLAADATAFQDGPLAPSTTYRYRIRAFNAEGPSAWGDTAQATTNGAGAADRLPDLGMARLQDFEIERVRGRRLLRYSTIIVNVGSGPFELHGRRSSLADNDMAVVHRIYDDQSGWREAATSAVMEFGGDGHDHWHVHDLELAELYRLEDLTAVARSDKYGFCFWDNREYNLGLPGAPTQEVYQESGCGDPPSLSTAMGLSVGWGDIYPYSLPDQYIDITGLHDGRYRLVVTADPANWFTEVRDDNNLTWVDLEIFDNRRNVRVLGYGPQAAVALGR